MSTAIITSLRESWLLPSPIPLLEWNGPNDGLLGSIPERDGEKVLARGMAVELDRLDEYEEPYVDSERVDDLDWGPDV
jgi:hypothetical protein